MQIKMTELQKAYLLAKEEDAQGKAGINLYLELLYRGQISDLEEAFDKLIAAQPMLRARVFDQDSFLIEEALCYKISTIDCRFDEQACVEQKRRTLAYKKYEASDYPFFTMEAVGKNEEFRIMFCVDQLIADSQSLRKLVGQLKMFLSNPLTPIHDHENELVRRQDHYQERRVGQYYQAAKEFYINHLERIYKAPQINYLIEQTKTVEFLQKERTISRERYARLKEKAELLSFTVTELLLTTYSLILSMWSKEPNLSISVADFHHPQDEKYDQTIGNFMSSYLLQTSFDFTKDFAENLQKVRVNLEEALSCQYFEATEIISEMKKKSASAALPVMFTPMLTNEEENFGDVLPLDYYVSQNPQVYLDFQARSVNGALSIVWYYHGNILAAPVLETMFSEYCCLLDDFLDAPTELVSLYKQKKKEELSKKYQSYNVKADQTKFQFEPLSHHFEKTLAKYPDQTFAILSNTEYTFRQLYTLAQQKALEIQSIKEIHQKDKVRIAFNGKKNIHSLTCILAAILTKDSFCAINEHFRAEKTEEILESLQNYLYFRDGEFIKAAEADDPIDPEEAYILHTSGTTGQPKGIIITERAALNTVYDIIAKFRITQADTVMNISNLYFDLTIFDIFGAIISGMSVAFVDIYEYAWFFQHNYYNKITIWNSTPALAKEFLLKAKFEHLRGVLVSGDFVPKEMVKELFSQYGPIQLYALGGATEASIWSNYYDCSSYENVSAIPYGWPLANQQLYVINAEGELCDLRVLGEICIAGAGLAKGYLSDEQTKEAFVWNEELGTRVYKTGDLGYLGVDNLIYIVGRVTSEIKHNGYRIDLREIEKYINRNNEVSHSVAFIKKLQDGRTRLNCAIVCRNAQDMKRKIRSELAKKLPLYMMPNNILLVPEIPLTGNGKVDIKTLCDMA